MKIFWQVVTEGRPLLIFVDDDHTFTLKRTFEEPCKDFLYELNEAVQLSESGMFSLYVLENKFEH